MAAKNKNYEPPFSDDENQVVRQKFPQAHPIFWGPNQKTLFPDTYNEPSVWREYEPLSIPATVRIIHGGRNVPISINRTIALGSTTVFGVRVFYNSDDGLGFDIGSGSFWKTFTLFQDISSLFSANMLSKGVIDLISYSDGVVRLNDTLPNKEYFGGPVPGTYTYNGLTRAGKKFIFNSGTRATPVGINPGGYGDFEFESLDIADRIFSDPLYNGATPKNGNKFWETGLSSPESIYWFLQNNISGSIPAQTNYLFMKAGTPGLSPGMPGFSDIQSAALGSTGVLVPGLILQP